MASVSLDFPALEQEVTSCLKPLTHCEDVDEGVGQDDDCFYTVDLPLPRRLLAKIARCAPLPTSVRSVCLIFQVTRYNEHQMQRQFVRDAGDPPFSLTDLM